MRNTTTFETGLLRLLSDAERIVRAYAEANPKFNYGGLEQDPNGCHDWLERIASLKRLVEG